MKTVGVLMILFLIGYIIFTIKNNNINNRRIFYVPKPFSFIDQIDNRIRIDLIQSEVLTKK